MREKYIIGLGCSWVQGEGGYTNNIWHHYNGRVNKPAHDRLHLLKMEHEHSWVNVLCRDYFPGYQPINLGQRSIGNRGAAKTLYLTNIDWSNAEGYVVYMLTALERFDFFKQDIEQQKEIEKGVKSDYKKISHYNFNTIRPWPPGNKLWKTYIELIYSEQQVAMETYANIMEVQAFCKAHGLKFIMASAFDGRGRHFIQKHCGELIDNINWKNYLHEHVSYESFVQLLVELDAITKYENYHEVYKKMNWPGKYLTNCIHPTIEGYKVIAKELAAFINKL